MIGTILINGLWQGGLIVAVAALATAPLSQREAATLCDLVRRADRVSSGSGR